MDWTEDWIAMYVNGNVYANYDKQAAAIGAFTDPLFLALTACVMNRVPVGGDDLFPLEYLIDYVRVYKFTE